MFFIKYIHEKGYTTGIRIANPSNKRISLKKVLFLIKYFQHSYPNANLKLMNFLWNTLHTKQIVALIWKTSGWLKN